MKTNRSKYPENSGFKLPENYFESLEERIMHRLEAEDMIDLPSKNPGFKVPEGYFDSLEERVIGRTFEKSAPRVIRLFKKEYLFYAAAVAALFILMLGNFFKSDSQQTIGWDDIEISAMENYIDEGYEMGFIDLNSAEYSEYLFEGGKLVDDSDFKNVNSEAVFDYLEENLDDPDYIIE